ncbi:MAG: RluA family pseudouridine synthase, partial [Butyrivibrio sp.]|nr:RluA family pseudouridine synthase [Butyrivibrio sp.]
DGDYAKTQYEVLKEYDGYSLIKLLLHTGRTHQIRVHMQYIGHPLLGDSLYGKSITDNHLMTRCALHSHVTEIYHPITGQKLLFTAPIPEDIESLIN